MVRTQGNDIQARRIIREVHSEDAIWMVRQKIQPRILGKVRKKLEIMKGEETCKKRDDEDDPRSKRN